MHYLRHRDLQADQKAIRDRYLILVSPCGEFNLDSNTTRRCRVPIVFSPGDNLHDGRR